MVRGPPLSIVQLTDVERRTLERWSRRPTTAQGLAQRSQIVLGAAAGLTNTAVAARLRLTRTTVIKWRRRFMERRLDGLLDEPRPGAPRTITDAAIEAALTRTLESPPVMRRIGRRAAWRKRVA